MFLSSVSIRNYRSIEDATLDNLDQFNVLIGRNNAGKSSVFGVLRLLQQVSRGNPNPPQAPDWRAIAPFGDGTRTLQIALTFTLGVQDREELINHLLAAGYDGSRRQALLDSAFARELQLALAESGGGFIIERTDLRSEDGTWAIVQTRSTNGPNPHYGPGHARVILLGAIAQGRPVAPLTSALFAATLAGAAIDVPVQALAPFALSMPDGSSPWLYTKVATYFNQAFFFTPFRHGAERMPAVAAHSLASDGSNLAQVLLALKNNDWRAFEEIQAFAQEALPGIGLLQTRLFGGDTEIYFESRAKHYPCRLADMGGGVEQLLMVATVLATTGDESTIFLEEPETHLHAGAQRFLVERLYAGSMNERVASRNRQIFVTTHSPTLINLPAPRTIHRVEHRNDVSVISRVDGPGTLEDLLGDIGVRNSDVLLSDAVLFVEGPADGDTLRAWGETLGLSLIGHNITVLSMGGGDDAARKAPLRQEVLAGISQKAAVPHLFVLDRDERSEREVSQLRDRLGTYVHILDRREMENYLLVPRALLAALRAKHAANPEQSARLEAATEDEVKELIARTANGLFDMVLLKRLRAEIGGLPGGFLPRDQIRTFTSHIHQPDFASILRDEIQQRVNQHLADIDIEAVVQKQRETLGRAWADEGMRASIAPGDEIVSSVFKHFDSGFRKTRDGALIARNMCAAEIDPEMRTVLERAVALADR